MKLRHYIVTCFVMSLLLAIISSAVFAESLDVNREIARRFTERGAALKIFMDNVKVDASIALPIYKVDFMGTLTAKPMVFADPTVSTIPTVVIQDEIANCTNNIAIHELSVKKETKSF